MKACPFCNKTRDMVPDRWAGKRLHDHGYAAMVCENPPCIYKRTLAKAEAAVQLLQPERLTQEYA